ncbi:hypothetical protein ABI59_14640 [Acidobacteria bacterium Mor1]|nr:hypothetical protein ABI59_14640 [Acidobacteria bacterium Mor1]
MINLETLDPVTLFAVSAALNLLAALLFVTTRAAAALGRRFAAARETRALRREEKARRKPRRKAAATARTAARRTTAAATPELAVDAAESANQDAPELSPSEQRLIADLDRWRRTHVVTDRAEA